MEPIPLELLNTELSLCILPPNPTPRTPTCVFAALSKMQETYWVSLMPTAARQKWGT